MIHTTKKDFRVIIAGGRDFSDYVLMCRTMDTLLSNISKDTDIVIVCGMARGADTLGDRYAKDRNYKVNYFPADWNTYGRAAGYKRNEQMAQNADALVAFWDGKSRGTKHMIDLARKYRLRVRIRYYNEII